MFKMNEKETIGEMFTRFTNIINSLIALGKVYTQVEMVRKLLRALTSDWEKKTTANRRSKRSLHSNSRELDWKSDGLRSTIIRS